MMIRRFIAILVMSCLLLAETGASNALRGKPSQQYSAGLSLWPCSAARADRNSCEFQALASAPLFLHRLGRDVLRLRHSWQTRGPLRQPRSKGDKPGNQGMVVAVEMLAAGFGRLFAPASLPADGPAMAAAMQMADFGPGTGGNPEPAFRDAQIPKIIRPRLGSLVKSKFPGVPVTVLTAKSGEKATRKSNDSGLVLFLTIEAIREEIEIHLQHPRPESPPESASDQITRLARDDFDDPLLERKPTDAQIQAFDRRYEMLDIADPTRLVPTLTIPTADAYTEDHIAWTMSLAHEKMRAADAALLLGRRTIAPATLQAHHAEEILNARDGRRLRWQLAIEIFRALPGAVRARYLTLIEKYYPADMMRLARTFFNSGSWDAFRSAHEGFLSSWLRADRFTQPILQFLEIALLEHSEDLHNYRAGIQPYDYLRRLPAADGLFIDSSYTTGPWNNYPSPDDDPRYWLTTPEGRELLAKLTALRDDWERLPPRFGWMRDKIAYLLSNWSLAIREKPGTNTDGETWEEVAKQAITPDGLHHGGVVIPGQGLRGSFVLVADVIEEAERRVLAWRLRERGVRLYSLPRGFVTVAAHGRRYWLSINHIDSVINIVDSEFTVDGHARILVDPFYYDHIRDHPEFLRLLRDQKIDRKEDVIVIDRADAHLNLANFAVVPGADGQKRMVFNGKSATLARLGLKPGVFVELDPPIQMLPIHLGLQRCLVQMLPPDMLALSPGILEALFQVDANVEPALKEFLDQLAQQNPWRAMFRTLIRMGLRKINVGQGPGPFAELDAAQVPSIARILAPDGLVSQFEIHLLWQELARATGEATGLANRLRSVLSATVASPMQKKVVQETQTLLEGMASGDIREAAVFEERVRASLGRTLLDESQELQSRQIPSLAARYSQLCRAFAQFYPAQAEALERGGLPEVVADLAGSDPPDDWRNRLRPAPRIGAEAIADLLTGEIVRQFHLLRTIARQLVSVDHVRHWMDLLARGEGSVLVSELESLAGQTLTRPPEEFSALILVVLHRAGLLTATQGAAWMRERRESA